MKMWMVYGLSFVPWIFFNNLEDEIQSKVRSHFSWSTITHDTFAKLWSTITHDHFFKILNDQITIMICDHFADHAPFMSNYTEGSSWPRNVTNSEFKSFWNKYMDLSSGKWIQRERDQIKDPIFCSYYIINKNRILSNFDYFFFCTTKYLISI